MLVLPFGTSAVDLLSVSGHLGRTVPPLSLLVPSLPKFVYNSFNILCGAQICEPPTLFPGQTDLLHVCSYPSPPFDLYFLPQPITVPRLLFPPSLPLAPASLGHFSFSVSSLWSTFFFRPFHRSHPLFFCEYIPPPFCDIPLFNFAVYNTPRTGFDD